MKRFEGSLALILCCCVGLAVEMALERYLAPCGLSRPSPGMGEWFKRSYFLGVGALAARLSGKR